MMNFSEWRTSFSLFVGGICIILLLGTFTRIVIEAEYAPDGETLYQLQTQIAAMKKQNDQLRHSIEAYSSFTYVATQAATLGLTARAHVIYLWPTH